MSRSHFPSRVISRSMWGLWLCVLGLVLLSGCGRGTFLGRQYDDFTAYYNTYHNAKTAFQKGKTALQEQSRTVDRTRYLPVFPDLASGGNEKPFENAVQKSSNLLRKHPNSRWTDNALLLIGKSYFYQKNYVGAARKFREVLALEEGRKDEAQFWLARTLVTSDRFDEASKVIERAVDTTGTPESEWTAHMQLVRGELLVRRQQWAKAATSLERGLTGEASDTPGARAAFLLGQVYEITEDVNKAQAAYRRVQEYSPPYELEFAARLSEIEVQGQHGNASLALDRLQDLQSDDKNLEKRGEMALVEARIYRAQGQIDQARSVLRTTLYDTSRDQSLSQTATRRLHYELATLYREAYQDFTQAAAHFDTARTSGQRSGGRQRLPTAPSQVGEQAEQYRSLAERAETVARLDSLLRIGRMSEEEFQAFLASKRQEQQAAQGREEEREMSAGPSQFRNRGEEAVIERRNQQTAAAAREDEAGFLFHKKPSRVQEGRRRFVQTWGDRPLVDNWRRRSAMRSAQDQEDAEEAEEGREQPDSRAMSEDIAAEETGIDVSSIPRDSASQAQMEAERARARYEFGNSLFLAAGRPDSAATWYRRVLREDGEQSVARRALYGLAEAYWAQGDTAAARETYERLVEQYPASELVGRARRRLDQQGEPTTENRSLQADSLYGRAYRRWERESGQSSLEDFLAVARQYPDTKVAPRALLASSIIYWRQLQADSVSMDEKAVEQYLRSVRPPDSTSTLTGQQSPDSTRKETATLSKRDADSIKAVRTDSVATDTASIEAERRESVQTAGTDSVRTDRTGTATGGTSRRRLIDLLRHLTERYPDARQQKRAQLLLEAIEKGGTSLDSLSTGRRRQAAASADSTRRERVQTNSPSEDVSSPQSSSRDDSPRQQPERKAGDAEPLPAPTSRRTSDSSTEDRGEWIVLVQSMSNADTAEVHRRRLQDKIAGSWSVEVLSTPGKKAAHLLVVGQFETKQQAQAVRTQLRKTLDRQLKVRRRPDEAAP